MSFIQYLAKHKASTAIKEMTATSVGVGSTVASQAGPNTDSFAAGDARIPKMLFKKPFRRKLARKRRRSK